MAVLVSIICLAFNQEKYIKDALDGFVMQKTDFPFEIVIHDDASVDNTAQIIKGYEKKYPDLLRPIYQNENQFSKERGRVTNIVLKAAKGKYIALCEGDDYWTDPYKLQKQVDFLEAHPDYSLCTHDFLVHYEHKDIPDKKATELYAYLKKKPIKGTSYYRFTIEDFSRHLDGLHTATNLIRTQQLLQAISEINTFVVSGDYLIKLLLLKQGDGVFIPELMSVLRKNPGGVSQARLNAEKYFEMQQKQLNVFSRLAPASVKKYFFKRLWRLYPNFVLGRKHYRKVNILNRMRVIPQFMLVSMKLLYFYTK